MASCHDTKLSPTLCGGGTILHPVLWTLVWPSGKAFFGEKIEWSTLLLSCKECINTGVVSAQPAGR